MMFLVRLFFDLVMGGLIAYCFRRSWNWEHGIDDDRPEKGRQTFVFTEPTLLITILLTVFVMTVLVYGKEEGFLSFMYFMLSVLLVFTLYFAVLLPLMPLIRKVVSARACSVLWIVPVFIFYNLYLLFANAGLPLYNIYIPKKTAVILSIVWFTGFVLFFGYSIITHLIFKHKVKDSSYEVKNMDVDRIWNEVREKQNYNFPVKLMISSEVKSPLSMGTTKKSRKLILPDNHDADTSFFNGYSEEELRMIFSHELHHLQRSDVDTKIFFTFLKAIFWFNPLVWIASEKAIEDLELSCDEIVVCDMNDHEKKRYADLLLSEASNGTGFTTCLSASAGVLRYRMKNLLKPPVKRKGTVLVALVFTLCLLSYGFIGFTFEKCTFKDVMEKELIYPDYNSCYVNHEIDSVIERVDLSNSAEFVEYIENLQLEKLTLVTNARTGSIIEPSYSGFLYLGFNTGFINIQGRLLEIYNYGNSRHEYYMVKNWDMEKLLSFEAS
ncbi:MAG: M56 family metallopeptidase [Clostridia bacterium]|nr:M56 family metallopeptidase [Clostridia bacterium]